MHNYITMTLFWQNFQKYYFSLIFKWKRFYLTSYNRPLISASIFLSIYNLLQVRVLDLSLQPSLLLERTHHTPDLLNSVHATFHLSLCTPHFCKSITLQFHCCPISLKHSLHTPSPPLLSFLHRLMVVRGCSLAKPSLHLHTTVNMMVWSQARWCECIYLVNETTAFWRKTEQETAKDAETKWDVKPKRGWETRESRKSVGSSGRAVLLLRGFPPGSNLACAW